MECVHHPELDRRLRECEELKRITMENQRQVSALFNYHDEHGKMLTEIRLTQTTMQANQQHSIDLLGEIKEQFKKHLEAFDVIAEEVKKFSWFRSALNHLRERLPWWMVYIICTIIAVLAINHKEVWERFGQLLGGMKQ